MSVKRQFITKLFKRATLNVAFKTQNTTCILLSQQNNHQQEKHKKCGVYQLTFPDCNNKYIKQTDRPIHIRFREQYHDYQYGKNKSKFAQHLLDNKYSVGPMENIMDIICTTNKGKCLKPCKILYTQSNKYQ